MAEKAKEAAPSSVVEILNQSMKKVATKSESVHVTAGWSRYYILDNILDHHGRAWYRMRHGPEAGCMTHEDFYHSSEGAVSALVVHACADRIETITLFKPTILYRKTA